MGVRTIFYIEFLPDGMYQHTRLLDFRNTCAPPPYLAESDVMLLLQSVKSIRV